VPETVAREVRGMRERRDVDRVGSHLEWPVSRGYPAGYWVSCMP
jgi:hypothetical protein